MCRPLLQKILFAPLRGTVGAVRRGRGNSPHDVQNDTVNYIADEKTEGEASEHRHELMIFKVHSEDPPVLVALRA